MQTLEKPADLIDRIRRFEPFEGVGNQTIQWVIDHSDYHLYEEGEAVFVPDMPVDHMSIMVDGAYVLQLPQKGELRDMGVWETGYVFGVLPFSRMTHSRARGTALRDSRVLMLHRDCFTDLVVCSYRLVQNLVALMSTRIREFSQLQYQNEKLLSLGKLSAGLAHELNNPASAMVRSAKELRERIHNTPEKFKAVITMRITPEQTDRVNAIIFPRIECGTKGDMGLLERTNALDALMDWLDDEGVAEYEEIAETFVDYGVTTDDLSEIKTIVKPQKLDPILNWMEQVLTNEALVNEIEDSADRIAQLIGSIKSYSHMDQSADRRPLDIHEGIISTVVMLKHKFKQKQIELDKRFGTDLPKITAVPGEMNQIWTNIIDNAVDAMDQGGKLTITTAPQRDMVCVTIQDNGSGIPQDVVERIFDPFFTTKEIGKGTGMGLDIVRKIINRHKGTINVSSEPGNTQFKICLPQDVEG